MRRSSHFVIIYVVKKDRYKEPRLLLGSAKKKVLLLLYAGIALSAARTTGKQWKILGEVSKEWKKINRVSLKTSIDSLYNAKLIDLRPVGDSYKMVLSQKGKNLAIKLDLENLEISKQKNWDGYWRVILFDIEERKRKLRNAIRFHFKEIGLVEYQKSVYIYPYPCEREIKFITEFFKVRRSVRFIVAKEIDDEEKIRKMFGLD